MKITQKIDQIPRPYLVYLNDQLLHLCLEADDEAGTALIAATRWDPRSGDSGETLSDPDSPYGVQTVEVKGKIRIEKQPSFSSPSPSPWGGSCGASSWDPCHGFYTPLKTTLSVVLAPSATSSQVATLSLRWLEL
jgi:hypothetical protein